MSGGVGVRGRWTRRQALSTGLGAVTALAGCTVSGSVQQQRAQEVARATPTVSAVPSPALTPGASPSAATAVPTPQPTFTPGGQADLRFGVVGSPAEVDAYRAIADAYATATPNTRVKTDPLPDPGPGGLDAATAAGSAPDVVIVPWDVLGAWSARGILGDLTPLASGGRIDLSGSFGPLQTYGVIGGRTFAVPVSFDPRVLYANVDLLGAAGLPAPDLKLDWQAFEAATARLAQGGDRSGFATATNPLDWAPWVWAAGGGVFDNALSPARCTLGDAPAAAGLQRFADLWLQHRGAAPPARSGTAPLDDFLAGRVGMIAGERSTLARLREARFSWKVGYLPQGPGGHATTFRATFVGVGGTGRQPLEASGFANFLATNRGAQVRLAKDALVVPALRAAATGPEFAFTGAAVDDTVYLQALLFATPPPRSPAWPAVQGAWQADLDRVWSGEQGAADAAKALTPRVDDALKATRAMPGPTPIAVQPPPSPIPTPAGTPPAPPAAPAVPSPTATKGA